MNQSLPTVSLIIPCYNEAAFIEGVIRDIQGQSYPTDLLEALFIDGRSTDQTRSLISEASQKDPGIKLLDNPDQYVPQAMNKGIRQSEADIIIRLDAHGAYPEDYVALLVKWSLESGAENVGGVWETRARSNQAKAKAIAGILAHPLGVGNSSFRLGVEEPLEVDTVPFGCYPRRVFDEYGLYDERLVRNQDIELNKRIRRKGGKILLVPEVSSVYYARDRFSSLWNNNFQTGRWVPLTVYYTKELSALSLRHFVPMAFVAYLMLLPLAFAFSWPLAALALIPLVLYFVMVFLASLQLASKWKSAVVGLYSFIGFPIIHAAYGTGTFRGLLESAWFFILGKK